MKPVGDSAVKSVGDSAVKPVEDKVEVLTRLLEEIDRVVVAFSGGADSAFLAHMATKVLSPERALCVTAVSPSLAPEEREDCRSLAREWGLRHLEVATEEMADARYVANDSRRCYYCKSHLMDALVPLAESEGGSVVLGVNVDDLSDTRPGQEAAAERGARFPLVEADFTKHDVRLASRSFGLRTWDKPSAPCLSSRVPYGTPVELGTLARVARAESALRGLGFGDLRVRHYGALARIELGEGELQHAMSRRRQVVAAVREAGYRFVTLDLEGLRSGNLNDPGKADLGKLGEPPALTSPARPKGAR